MAGPSSGPPTLGAWLWQQCRRPVLRRAPPTPTHHRHSDNFLRARGATGIRIIDAILKLVHEAFSKGKRLETTWSSCLEKLQHLRAPAAVTEGPVREFEADLEQCATLENMAVGLLGALLGQDAPQLQLEAGRIKACIERLRLQGEAASASKIEGLRVRHSACAASLLPNCGSAAFLCLRRFCGSPVAYHPLPAGLLCAAMSRACRVLAGLSSGVTAGSVGEPVEETEREA